MTQGGSPPRVRGTAIQDKNRAYQIRITPACAGNRTRTGPWRLLPWDHPRVCGEQPAPPPAAQGPMGSPPRVRGTDIFYIPLYTDRRITPACAGNSPLREA